MPRSPAHRHQAMAVKHRHGFSLIELMVVLAIMAALATIGMPLAELSHQRFKEEDLRRSLREIRTALDAYKRLVDQGRIVDATGGSGYPPNLATLEEGVIDAKSPEETRLYLLRRLPRDPFAPEDVTPAQTWGLRSYASRADDPRPGRDVYDVYSKATGTGLNGIPYRRW